MGRSLFLKAGTSLTRVEHVKVGKNRKENDNVHKIYRNKPYTCGR
jgi:hypothetical protein